jgi:hypothetical protein
MALRDNLCGDVTAFGATIVGAPAWPINTPLAEQRHQRIWTRLFSSLYLLRRQSRAIGLLPTIGDTRLPRRLLIPLARGRLLAPVAAGILGRNPGD